MPRAGLPVHGELLFRSAVDKDGKVHFWVHGRVDTERVLDGEHHLPSILCFGKERQFHYFYRPLSVGLNGEIVPDNFNEQIKFAQLIFLSLCH